jgi:dipeptidyl aminopeptidase/acylaminoacyl peptidase
MPTRLTLLLVISLLPGRILGNDVPVREWLGSGPVPVLAPGFIDGPNLFSVAFGPRFILSNPYLNLGSLVPEEGMPFKWVGQEGLHWNLASVSDGEKLEIKPIRKKEYQLAYQAFYIASEGLNKHELTIESPQMFEVFLQGKKITSSYRVAAVDSTSTGKATLELDRGKFLVIVKSLYARGSANPWWIRAKLSGNPLLDTSPTCGMNIHHLLEGTKLGQVSISPDATLVMVNYSRVNRETGEKESWTEVREVATGRVIQSFRKAGTTGYRWMPSGKKLYYTRPAEKGSSLWVFDLAIGKEYPVLENIEELSGTEWSPDERFVILTISEKKKADTESALRYMDELGNRTFPDKSVSSLYKHDVSSHVTTRLTFGEYSTRLHDISRDGRSIVFSVTRPDPTVRPFSQQDMYTMDLKSGKVDTLWKNSPWSGTAEFSPDGKQLLVSGGPDLFGATGRNIGDQPLANNYDTQAYIYDLSTGEIDPITRDFNPTVIAATWHPLDGRIYLTTEDEVYRRLYVYDPLKKQFLLVPTVPEVLGSFSLSAEKLVAAYTGTGLGRYNKAWILDVGTGSSRLFDDVEAGTYEHVRFGIAEDWDFKKDDGTLIRGFFLYPRDFDEHKKYPLIVQYYGGTNPIPKSFGGRYPVDIWAGDGYVVYVPQPSGATGFGQEFSARHQNNWGKTVADEIIEGTKKFIAAHDFIDTGKIGCIGASYGGFMTMLLQTRTDMFTCAISHAGISSISSYWGEGYWGYAYSANATGDAYPWNRKDIYVDQSALFNADKIHTPLLLLHGSKDTNVPLGESLQLWVGLKILGRPVEMVQVEGEDHWILSYTKRIEWHHTIMAWFDKWLKDKPGDWSTLFPESEL